MPLSSRSAHGLGRALLRLAGLLTLVSLATFVLLSHSPIDPVKAYIGSDLLHVPPEQYAKIAARWGQDLPLWQRYSHWLGQVLRGDLGYSLLHNAPVVEVIGQRFAASFVLLAGSWLLSGLLGILLGLCAGRYLNRWPDRLICRLSYLLASLPTFWLGLLLLALFAVYWPLLPVCCAWTPGLGSDEADWLLRTRHLVLPMATLTLLGVGNIALHTRGRVAEVLGSDFIRYARAQGDGGWPMLRFHVLRHVLTPAICLQFASLGELIGGSLLVEKVFSYPGLGQATVEAGLKGDIPLLMGIVLFCTLLVFFGNSVASGLLARLNRGWEGQHAV